jgi:cell division protein ZapE
VTVVASLQRDVAAGLLEADAAQIAAAARLDALALALRAAHAGGGLPGPLRQLRRLLRGAAPTAAQRGIYLWGGVGRGKTYLMDLFHSALDAPWVRRTHFYRFMRDVHTELQAVRRRANPLRTVARRIAARTRVICLDEFFVADIADAMILGVLLESLFAEGVTLVATSNQPPRGLYPDGLQRQRFLPAIDMIERQCEVIEVDGQVDYRLRQLESAQVYFDSAQADTGERLSRLFAALTHGAGSGRTQLVIGARRIDAVDSGPGVAWFGFDSLCRTARSAEDYIELARQYPTMFISQVPQLGADDDDAARRLLILIDECYDRGVKLVISAASEPAGLYRGQRLTFEFQRTTSRLIEMQSQTYLGREHRA